MRPVSEPACIFGSIDFFFLPLGLLFFRARPSDLPGGYIEENLVLFKSSGLSYADFLFLLTDLLPLSAKGFTFFKALMELLTPPSLTFLNRLSLPFSLAM